jgi:GntR family transcriptional regulator
MVGKRMNIHISHTSGAPIYEQIKNQITEQILSGLLPDATLLPSIRSLAQYLQISVITTKRAYDELEREGLVVSVAGKGTYVSAQRSGTIREARYRKLEERIKVIVEESRALGLAKEELIGILSIYLEEGDKDESH